MLNIALLGRYEIWLAGEQLDLRFKPVELLLANLLLKRGKKQRRDQLAGLLWPDYTESSARKNLRNSIYRLRQAIGEDFLLVDRSTVMFNTAAAYQLDVAQIEDLSGGGEVENLIQAAALYQGELLPGYYEDWIIWERERLQAAFDRLMQQLLDKLSAAQRWQEVLTWSEHWIAQGQLPEPAFRAAMSAYAALDDQSGLAYTYRRVQQALDEALGVPPARETDQLYRKLLASAAEGIDPHTEQSESASPQDEDAASKIDLPLPSTRLIGRQRELEELGQFITDRTDGRLVSIVGPGGIGKSRLALETAKDNAANFQDGVTFIPLAAVNDEQHILTTISDHVGFRHSTGTDPRLGLLHYLQEKQLLIVLDNFEHLLAYVNIVTDLLQHAAQVKILCTSRERLNLDAELVYLLSGLEYPPPVALDEYNPTKYGAVQLFLLRVSLVQPGLRQEALDMEQIVRICRLVQGMPLALILAAGWLEMLTVEEVADEISSSLDILESHARDMPERQRSVRAAFDYSWRLLAENDRQAFSRLAVFRGGFSRRAAQHVASARLPRLRSLVEKSLVAVVGPDRYLVHELLRQFAQEKLVLTGQERSIRTAHSHYYLEALAARKREIKGQRQLEALQEIEIDLDNVRAAWAWAVESQDWDRIDQAQESLSLFYYIQARNEEGFLSFRKVIEGAQEDRSRHRDLDPFLARLTARAGLLQSQLSVPDAKLERELQGSLVTAQAIADEREIAFAYLALGHYFSKVTGNYPSAVNCFEQAVERYRSLEDDYYLAHALHRLGYCHSYETTVKLFYHYTRQSLELASKTGNLADAANAVGNLGAARLADGFYGQAQQYLNESIALSRLMNSRKNLGHELIILGLSHLMDGNLDEAQEEAEKGLAMAKALFLPLTIAYGLAVLSVRASCAGNYELGCKLASDGLEQFTNPLGEYLCHWALSIAYLGLDQAEEAWSYLHAAMRYCLEFDVVGLMTWTIPPAALIRFRWGDRERAAEILGLYYNHPRRPVGWAEAWPLLVKEQRLIEEDLGRDAFEASWENGRSLDLKRTIRALFEAHA